MDPKVSFAERMQRVDQVIHDLGLTKCQNTRIGDPAKNKGISGGEMKRLAFASEYITDPMILLCDEPTSGLDAFMAQSVVEVMQKMAQQGKSIICTIHQPASEVFEMFDHICLLSAGRVAFSGTTAETLAFFDETGYPCPVNYNPADFFIFTLAIDPADEENCKARSDVICAAYAKSARHDEIETLVKFRKPHIHHDHSHHGSKLGLCNSPYRVGWCTQFEALLHRTFITTIREPLVFVARFVQIMATASLLALVFYQQPINQSGLKNINATIFMIMLFMTVVNTFGVIFVFCGEIPIFLREHWNGMYRTDAYFLSKTLVELPFMVVYALMFDVFVYYAVGLVPGWKNFMWCCIITILVANASASFGYFMSTVCKDLVVAFAITPPLLVPIFLFSGFFIRDEVTPWFWKWAKYCTWFYYGCETLFTNQWMTILDIDNEKNETLFLSDGEQVLMFFGYDYRNFEFDIIALGALIVFIRGAAYVSLLMKTYNRK
jgi:ABC-type multidrug transport system permease subunit